MSRHINRYERITTAMEATGRQTVGARPGLSAGPNVAARAATAGGSGARKSGDTGVTGSAVSDAAGNEGGDHVGRRATAPSRGEMVSLALQIDAMIARSDEMGLDLVAYLLGVARAELGERLGEAD